MPRNKNQNLYVILSSHNNFISIFYYVTLSNAFNSPFGFCEITKRIYKKKKRTFLYEMSYFSGFNNKIVIFFSRIREIKASVFGLESGKILDEANIFNRTKRNYQGIENQTDDCSLTMFCWDGTFFSSAMMMMIDE